MNLTDEGIEKIKDNNINKIRDYALDNLKSTKKTIEITYNQNGAIIESPNKNEEICKSIADFYKLKIHIEQNKYFKITTIEIKKIKLPKGSFNKVFKKFTKSKDQKLEELLKQEGIIEQFDKKTYPDKLIYDSVVEFNKKQKINYEKGLQETRKMNLQVEETKTPEQIAQTDIKTPQKLEKKFLEELN